MKIKISHLQSSFVARPPLPPQAEASPVSGPAGAERGSGHTATPAALPPKLGPVGPLATGRIFDNKIAGQSESQLSTRKGGDQWKGKTERYLISVVPAVHAIFQWAGREADVITQDRYEQAVGDGLCTWDRDGVKTDILTP